MLSGQGTASAWKSIDDAIRALERLAQLLKPLHRDLEVSALAAQIRLRRQQPFYVYCAPAGELPADGNRVQLPGLAGLAPAVQVRAGVYALTEEAPIGVRRQFCDVTCSGNAPQTSDNNCTAAVLTAGCPSSEADTSLAAFGAGRQTWFALEQAQKLVSSEVAGIDRVLLSIADGTASDSQKQEESAYLESLQSAVKEKIDELRERARNRDVLQRSFDLAIRQLVTNIGTSAVVITIKPDALDRYRPAWLKKIIGKTQLQLGLSDKTINMLVDSVERISAQAGQERGRKIARAIEKIGPGRFERHFGCSVSQWLSGGSSQVQLTRVIHEAVAGAGRGFNVKLERLGAVNRLMRARMEVAGILMLVFLFASAWGASSWRRPVIIVTLVLAFVIAILSYFTTPAIEEARKSEEIARLREQLAKAGAEAAALYHSGVLSRFEERLAELRDQLSDLLSPQSSTRFQRSSIDPPALRSMLASLRSDLTREVGSSNGIAAIKQQLSLIIGPASSFRSLPS